MKNQPYFIFIALLLLFIPWHAFAQEIPELSAFNQTRINYNESGMIILGSWAVGNMIWGGIGASNSTGQTKAFHQMNIYWNSVNLIIAGFGFWQASNEGLSNDLFGTLDAQQKIEKILLFNTALDVAYMAGGMYLKERGLRLNKDKFIGFGKSIILQGAFLFTFDALMYTFHAVHAKELPGLVQQISLNPNGFTMTIPLSKR
ncbi:MAG: hypothetical protein P8O16_03630 [Algoriphagus sp.]|uniref:DUF6992 family protein n=1 Tax=Algoriphagus sp. TaxID=1872435 RepID=UPI002629B1B5|nr:hypothetical protein [Algoriphagus sp.]MDG1276345.1 hypothetical protein [Algoriphagus sp.]